MDIMTPDERSARMARIRGRDTKPEMIVRRLVHRLGYRFRLHRRDLPGTPDLVFPGRKKVVFVHGCFWHGHDCRQGRTRPATRAEFWAEKIDRNRVRDADAQDRLARAGWAVLVVWQCELKAKDRDALAARLSAFLG